MGEDNSTPIIEDSTHAAGNGAGGKEGDVAVKEERRKHLLAFGVGMAIFVAAIVIGVFAMRACSDQHHSQYATGQEYTATGYVVKADKETRRTGSDRKTKHTVYTVKLEMDEPLPNGETTFESGDLVDYDAVSRFDGMPNTHVEFTFDSKGYLKKAEKAADDKGEDIDKHDPGDIARIENMNDAEKEKWMLEQWQRNKDKEE